MKLNSSRQLRQLSLSGVFGRMNPCEHNVYMREASARFIVSVLIAFFVLFVFFSYWAETHAKGEHAAANDKGASINVWSSDDGYSLIAEQAHVTDILRALGSRAGFEVKILGAPRREYQDWRFDSVPLLRLLDNLLRGYNTVQIHEQDADRTRRLKELWLITRYDDVAAQPGLTIKIELEQTETGTEERQQFTPEQQYQIDSIDDLQGMTGEDVIATLQRTLVDNDDPVVRARAAIALGDIGGTRVLGALEAGLGDSSGRVRSELARSFSSVKHQRSTLALGQMLMGDRDAQVRQQAVRSLRGQDSPAAYLFVEAALKDKDERVQEAASRILRQWARPD